MRLRNTFSDRQRRRSSSQEAHLIPKALLVTAAVLSPHAALQAGPVPPGSPAQTVGGDSVIQGNQNIHQDLTVLGNTNIKGLTVDGNQNVTGSQTVGGGQTVSGISAARTATP